ncbi:MAG TPA: hypothetical protein VF504_02065, partial [Solirubrobacterales bacterium]
TAAVIDYGRMLASHEFFDGAELAKRRGALIGGRGREQAESLWRSAAESGHSDAAWAWLGLGRLLEDPPGQGDESDLVGAEEAFEHAVHCGHAASRTFALHKLGRMKWRLGKTDEATAALNVGATSGDKEWAPFCAFDLGRLYSGIGNEEEAGFWWYQAASSAHPRISPLAQEAIDNPNSIWRMR